MRQEIEEIIEIKRWLIDVLKVNTRNVNPAEPAKPSRKSYDQLKAEIAAKEEELKTTPDFISNNGDVVVNWDRKRKLRDEISALIGESMSLRLNLARGIKLGNTWEEDIAKLSLLLNQLPEKPPTTPNPDKQTIDKGHTIKPPTPSGLLPKD